MDRMKVKIIESPYGGRVRKAIRDADIVISAFPTVSDDKRKVELRGDGLYAVSPEIIRTLSQVECVESPLLFESSGIKITLFNMKKAEAIEVNDLLESLREVCGDLEISTYF